MELATLDVTKKQALDGYREYAAAVKRDHAKEDEILRRAYHAIAKGRQVIDLAATIARGGEDAQHRPRLAVLHADATWCHLRRTFDGSVTFAANSWPRSNARAQRFPSGTLPRIDFSKSLISWEWRAMVPSIQPRHRPPTSALSHYDILWEAEWSRAAPADPALLKPLGSGLYIVVATWDLTALERSVLAGSRLGVR